MATHPDPSSTSMLHPHPFHPNAEHSTPLPDVNSINRRAKSTSYEERPSTTENHDPVSRHTIIDHSSEADVESTHIPQYNQDSDPYELASKLKTSSELKLIRANTSRKRDAYGSIAINKDARQARKLQYFYENQNENIERWLKPVDEHVRLAKEFEGAYQLQYKIAVIGSFFANLALAGLQLYAAISSGSLSLLATMADAVFDPLSNVTLMLCNRAVKRVNPRTFPSGKARIETAGNIVFCFLMTSVSSIILVVSIQEIVGGHDTITRPFHLRSVIAVGIAFSTKLVLFIYCWALRNVYSQVRILWEDHRNDLLINGFGLLMSIGGSRYRWWIDPLGAIILAIVVSILWLRTAYTEFQLLIGISADISMQQWITYICMLLSLLNSPFLASKCSCPYCLLKFKSFSSHLHFYFMSILDSFFSNSYT